MIRFLYIIPFTCFSYLSFGQNGKDLLGTWKLQYSLQPKNRPCNIKQLPSIITFKADSTYSWKEGKSTIKGKWRTENSSIIMFNNKAFGFSGTVADLNYPFEFMKDNLVIHQPEGGDISCPNLYFKKQK